MISSEKQTFLVTEVSGTLICMCAYNLLALHSSFFNVFATSCEGERPRYMQGTTNPFSLFLDPVTPSLHFHQF